MTVGPDSDELVEREAFPQVLRLIADNMRSFIAQRFKGQTCIEADALEEAANRIQADAATIAGMREALTPSGETKAAYHGEFYFSIARLDEDGNEYTERVYVPWDTTKEIMAAIRARAALTKLVSTQ